MYRITKPLIAFGTFALSGAAFAGTDTQVNGVDATDTITMSAEVTSTITITVAGDGTDTVLTDTDATLDFGTVDAFGNQTTSDTSGSNTVNATYGGAFVIGTLEVTVEFQGYTDADVTLERGTLSGTGASTPDMVYNVGAAGSYDWSANTGTAIPETPTTPDTIASAMATTDTVDLQVGFGLVDGTEAGTYTTDLLLTAIGN